MRTSIDGSCLQDEEGMVAVSCSRVVLVAVEVRRSRKKKRENKMIE
jgi:hypothetical protein